MISGPVRRAGASGQWDTGRSRGPKCRAGLRGGLLNLLEEEGHQVPQAVSGSVPTWTGFIPRSSSETFGPPAVR